MLLYLLKYALSIWSKTLFFEAPEPGKNGEHFRGKNCLWVTLYSNFDKYVDSSHLSGQFHFFMV